MALKASMRVNGIHSQADYKGILALMGDLEEEITFGLRDSDQVTIQLVIKQED